MSVSAFLTTTPSRLEGAAFFFLSFFGLGDFFFALEDFRRNTVALPDVSLAGAWYNSAHGAVRARIDDFNTPQVRSDGTVNSEDLERVAFLQAFIGANRNFDEAVTKGGNLTLDLWRDEGLQKGHTLKIFRINGSVGS
jgi:hypothetical protein